MLLMLEDDAARVERFSAVLQDIAPEMKLQVWRSAHGMIREAEPMLVTATWLPSG